MDEKVRQNLANEIADLLLGLEAVVLRPSKPFVWTSGLISPIYCDNRQIISHPQARAKVADGLVDLIKDHFPQATAIAGTATAGIPHAAWISERLDLPMVYVRSKAKEHGRQSQIEGRLSAGDKVVIIEDLISTGGSSLEAAKAVAKEAEVLGVAAIFSYDLLSAQQAFKEANLKLVTLTDFPCLLAQVEEKASFSPEEIQTIKSWYEDFRVN